MTPAAPLQHDSTADHPLPLRKRMWLREKIDDWSDWLNPILIKETRQVATSRAFVWTFFVLVLLCWISAVATVLLNDPAIRYQPYGPSVMTWYGWLMTIPLVVVVPFATFRSMEIERQNATFDLVSITTIEATQIVRGKLVAMLVMAVVLLSVFTPCLAFGYMLGGVDLAQTLSVPAFLMVVCLTASAVAVLLGSLPRSATASTLHSMALLSGLLAGAIVCLAMVRWLLGGSSAWYLRILPSRPSIAVVVFLLAVTLCELAIAAAAANLTPPEVNRSSLVRKRLLLVHGTMTLAMGMTVYGFPHHRVYLLPPLWMATAFWFMVGTLLVAERPNLTARVRRELAPKPYLRIVQSWWVPGSAAGFLFAIAGMGSLTIVMMLVRWHVHVIRPIRRFPPQPFAAVAAMNWLLFVGYLGTVRLVWLRIRRRFPHAGFFPALAVSAGVLLLGNLVPALLAEILWPGLLESYSPLLITVWPVTLRAAHLVVLNYRPALGTTAADIAQLYGMIGALVALVLFLNLRSLVTGLFAGAAPAEPVRQRD